MKMKKRDRFPLRRVFITALLLLLTASGIGAQDLPMIAVLPFQSIEVSASVAQIITTLFETNPDRLSRSSRCFQ